MTIRIDIEKPEELLSKYDEVEDRIEQTVTLLMIELEEIAMNTAPIKTGELRISHTWSVNGSAGEMTNTVPYLQWVLYGRGWVFPVEKKALYWEELLHPVAYARPAPPNDYFSAAVAYIDAKGIVGDSFIEWLIS